MVVGMRVYDMLILLRTSWQTIKDCSYTQSSKLKFRSGYWVFCRKDPRWHCEPKSNNLFCSILGQPSLRPMGQACWKYTILCAQSNAEGMWRPGARPFFSSVSIHSSSGVAHRRRLSRPGSCTRMICEVTSMIWSLKSEGENLRVSMPIQMVNPVSFQWRFLWGDMSHISCYHKYIYILYYISASPCCHCQLLVELGTKLTKVAEVEKYFSPWIPTQHRNAASFKLDSTMVYSTPGIPQVYVSPMEPLLGRSSGNCCFFILRSTSKKSMSHGVTGDYHPEIMQEFIRIWHHQVVSGQFPSDFTWASKPTSGALRWALGFACAIAEGFNWEATEIGHRGTARMVLDSGLKCLAIPAKQTSHLSFFVGKERVL